MIHTLVGFSLRNKPLILLMTLALAIWGFTAAWNIPLDATPDITNNQVQVVTNAPALAPQEMEAFVTAPLERNLLNLPGVEEVRSVSRYGLSIVTVVFHDDVPVLDARQLVRERLEDAAGDIPAGYGVPEMMPMTTGLGEVYQYVLRVDPAHRATYSLANLRFIQDWDVKLGLAGIPGVVEISSFGGVVRQLEVAVVPSRLNALGLSMDDVAEALRANNANAGGSYIARGDQAFYIRADGVVRSLADLEDIALQTPAGTVVRMRDVAQIAEGNPPRFGAMTMDGKGEVVGGITLMLRGGNSLEVSKLVEERVAKLNQTLPDGIALEPYLNRSELVGRTTSTVVRNLTEGGLIVIFVLVIMLGQWRSGWVVASIIPLSLLFALGMMHLFGVSANLMSLGALDFGIVVDGAVIIVEAVVHRVHSTHAEGRQSDELVLDVTRKVFRSAAFGVLIILVVLFPVLTLGGIEGKMFRPMVQTVSFALIGALILSVTFVPVASSLWLTRDFKEWSITTRLVGALQRWFKPALNSGLMQPKVWLGASLLAFVLSIGWFTQLGAVFLPTLEEGDLAMQLSVAPGSTLEHSIKTCSEAERILMEQFPEVRHVVSKIGTAEVPTDPMGIEDADVMIILKPKDEWVTADNREDLVERMKEALSVLEGAEMEFTQPIQLRFNELLTGAKSDLALKVFGPDHEVLHQTAEQLAEAVRPLEGVADLRVERTEGMNTLTVVPNRFRMSQFGLTVEEVNQVLQTAFSGLVVGKAFEADRSMDVVVRAAYVSRQQFDLSDYHLMTRQGERVPLSELVTVTTGQGPLQISREQGMRRVVVGINVRNRDVESLVNDIKQLASQPGMLPPGYSLAFDGQFKNLEQARNRLAVAVPLALGLILVLLFFAFRSMKYALMIFLAVPLSSIGGVLALGLRGMPFSISAGVGFIALFGVAVLNGIVLVSHMNDLRISGMPLREVLLRGPMDRLRPVLMTAAVAALGFLPMALSNGAGAEVQRPLATVVIGGLVSATLLTLVLLPVMYGLLNRPGKWHFGKLLGVMALLGTTQVSGQNYLTADKAVEWAMVHNPELRLMEMEAKAAKAGVKQAYDVAPVAVDVTYGQINEYTRDYNIAVYQNLGSILQNVKNAKALRAGVVEREATVAYQRRETEYLVRLAYEGWMHAVRQEAEVSRDEVRFRAMTEIIEVGYKTGNISSMDRAAARGKWAAYRNRLSDARAFRASKEREFMHLLLYTDTLLAPEEWPILVPRPDTGALPEVLIEPYRKRAEVAKIRYQANKAEYFPELTVGYFNQSIGLISGFEGVSLGLSFPLWFRPTQGRIQQAGIEAEAAELEAEVTAMRWEQLRREAYSQLWYHHQRLEDYRDASFEDAIMLYETSIIAFQSGETDVFRLFDAFLTVIDLKLEYLALVEAHNSAVLTVNYLSEFE